MHPEYGKLKNCKASAYVPMWRLEEEKTEDDALSVYQPAAPPANKKKKNRKKKNKTKVTQERNDIPEFKQEKDIPQNEPLSHQEIAQPKANESSPPQKINPTNDPDCAESTTKSAIMADT